MADRETLTALLVSSISVFVVSVIILLLVLFFLDREKRQRSDKLLNFN
jgi:predicted PurR-regulated permease PerM